MCLLCGNEGVDVELISLNSMIIEDIIENFGARVADFVERLRDYKICTKCVSLLEHLAKLKRKLRYLLLRPIEERKPEDLKYIYDVFSSLNLVENENEVERCIPTPAASSVYTCTYSKKYREPRRQKGTSKRKRAWSTVSNCSHVSGNSRPETRTTNYTPFSNITDYISTCTSRAGSPVSDITGITGISRRSRKQQTNKIQVPTKLKDEKKITCPKCDAYFCTREKFEKITIHLQLHHGMKPLYPCTECGQKFAFRQHLSLHSKTHDEFPLNCFKCGWLLPDRLQLQYHLYLHSIAKESVCTVCDKYFLNKYLLRSHRKKYHPKWKKQKEDEVKQRPKFKMINFGKKVTSTNIEGQENQAAEGTQEGTEDDRITFQRFEHPQIEREGMSNYLVIPDKEMACNDDSGLVRLSSPIQNPVGRSALKKYWKMGEEFA